MEWKNKDFTDQPLHTLAGFTINLTTSVFTGSWLVGVVIAQAACIIRESRQHKKFTICNLDSIFWALGNILGTILYFIIV